MVTHTVYLQDSAFFSVDQQVFLHRPGSLAIDIPICESCEGLNTGLPGAWYTALNTSLRPVECVFGLLEHQSQSLLFMWESMQESKCFRESTWACVKVGACTNQFTERECECVCILRRVRVVWLTPSHANHKEWVLCHRKGRLLSILEKDAIQSVITVIVLENKREILGRGYHT